MNRLTQENLSVENTALCTYIKQDCDNSCMQAKCPWQEKANRALWRYENTKMSPDEVMQLKSHAEALSHAADMPIVDLCNLVTVYKAGRIVELPCKVGDTVWCLYSIPRTTYDSDERKWFIDCFTVERFSFMNWVSADISQFGTVNIKEFGKTVFLTPEAAQKALEDKQ